MTTAAPDFVPRPRPGVSGAEALVEELTHRVANDYTRMIATIRCASRQVSDSGSRAAIEEILCLMDVNAQYHRALRAPTTSADTDMGRYLFETCSALTLAVLEPCQIRLTLIPISVMAPVSVCWRVSLIVAELVCNAARHGLGNRSGDIVIEMRADNRGLCVLVRDSGRAASLGPAGRGQRVVKALAEDIGATARWEAGPNGTVVTVNLGWLEEPEARIL